MKNEIFDIVIQKFIPVAKKEYEKGRMVSERHLQVIFFMTLSEALDENKYSLLIEPKIQTLNDSIISGLIPDALIVKNKEVVCIIEMKYIPYNYIEYKKDFGTFQKFYKLQGEKSPDLLLEVVPETGLWNNKGEYKISKDLKFLYIALGRDGSDIFKKTREIVCSYLPDTGNSFRPIFFIVKPNSALQTVDTLN